MATNIEDNRSELIKKVLIESRPLFRDEQLFILYGGMLHAAGPAFTSLICETAGITPKQLADYEHQFFSSHT